VTMTGPVAGPPLGTRLAPRRTLLLLLLGGLMLLVALGLRIGAEPLQRPHATARPLEALRTAPPMPLVALLFGTATIGAELEEGTAISLLAKPVPRWQT